MNSVGLEEEIIELQDLRMSPIPSLRNRHKAKYYKEPGGGMGLPYVRVSSIVKLTSAYFQVQIKASHRVFECTVTTVFQCAELIMATEKTGSELGYSIS